MSAPIVAFINAKGGSGATTLAIETSKVLRRGNQIAIVDGDLSGRRNLAVLLDTVRAFDAARSSGVYSVIDGGGMTACELTDSLDNSFMLRVEEVDALVDKLSKQHDAIMVDAPTPFVQSVRPFIVRATRFIIVLEPNLLGTAAARTLIGDLAKFGVPLSRVWIVTNLRGGRAEISVRELERALGGSVIAEVPPKGDRMFARAIEGLAKRISSVTPEAPIAQLRQSTAPQRSSNSTEASSNGNAAKGGSSNGDPSQPRPAGKFEKLKAEVHEQITHRIDVVAASRAHTEGEKLTELRAQISEITANLLAERTDVEANDRTNLQQEIIDEVLGLGPLEDLMRDEAVSEIMVNGAKTIYVERAGKITLSDKTFQDERHLRTIVERIIAPLGRRIDESSPMVDARLADGSRVNAIIEPLSLDGSTLTIRRFGKKRLTIDDLVGFGSLSLECKNLLRAIVQSKLNVLVSGGTGSGKTTFLNILSSFIPSTDRIVTIEDAAELSLPQPHVIRLESRPANLEGRGAITIRDLVKNSLRMRPDRIVVGECRSGEALDMLQAMNTGHDGSLTTLHANTPRDALSRLETLVLMAGYDLPIRAIREQIASAVDVIVQTARLKDGSRKIMSIAEVVGMEGDIVTMHELVVYRSRGFDQATGKVIGDFQYTGVQPHYLSRFEEAGIDYDARELGKMPTAAALW